MVQMSIRVVRTRLLHPDLPVLMVKSHGEALYTPVDDQGMGQLAYPLVPHIQHPVVFPRYPTKRTSSTSRIERRYQGSLSIPLIHHPRFNWLERNLLEARKILHRGNPIIEDRLRSRMSRRCPQ